MRDKTINIGGVHIPLVDYAVSGTAILGIRDSGKTVTAKGIAEQLLDHDIPIIVFDAVGKWRYLKLAGEGKRGRGYKVVVAGGRDGDLPLNPHSVSEIVRASIKENIPLIIDLYDPKLSKADWRRIVQQSIRIIHYENEGIRHVFLEEAAEYCPQKVYDGETFAEVEKFVRMGGNASVGLTLINQRSQEVNKAVLDLCQNLILGCQIGNKAIEAVEKWVDRLSPDIAQQVTKSLPKLRAGEAWVWTKSNPDLPHREQLPMCRSLHPDRRTPEKSLAASKRADVGTFVSRLSSVLPKIAEEAKANDPKELRKQVADLRKQLEQSQAAKPASKPEFQKVDVPVVSEKDLRRMEAMLERISMIGGTLAEKTKPLNDKLNQVGAAIAEIVIKARAVKAGPDPIALARKAAEFGTAVHVNARGCKPMTPPAVRAIGQMAKAATTLAASGRSESDSGLSKLERALLTVLAQRPNERIEKGKLLTLADYRWSGNVSDAFTKFINEGLAVGDRSAMQITESGIAVLGDFEPLPTGEALRQQILAKSSTLERALLEVLFSIYPDRIGKGELLERANYKWSGNVSDAFTKFLRAGWAVGSRSELAASAELFEE